MEIVEEATVRGRGGAGFPAGTKWRFTSSSSCSPSCPRAERLEVGEPRWPGVTHRADHDLRHPYLAFQHELCISCGRCVRACDEVLGSVRADGGRSRLHRQHRRRMMRAAIGTNNIDHCSRVCHSPTSFALRKSFGLSGATGSFTDIDHAEVALLMGVNPTQGHLGRGRAH